jgi:RNA polymerase sporulation-specific sigma factor
LTAKEKNEYAEKNIALVHHMANKFRNSGHQYDDLVGIGMVGFTKALNTYEKGKNTKVSTYALSCIRNEILHFLRKENKHLKNTTSAEKVIYKHSEGRELFLLDVLSDETEQIEEKIISKENISELLEEISKLPEREQKIINHRFGLGGRKILKQREVGKMLDMTQANVSKLESAIIEKLLKALKEKEIEKYVE